VLEGIRKFEGVQEATIFGHFIHALVLTARLEALSQFLPGARINPIEPSLEDVFVTLTYKIMKDSK
jgi:ABC-2 type transport system ATP-binding protein